LRNRRPAFGESRPGVSVTPIAAGASADSKQVFSIPLCVTFILVCAVAKSKILTAIPS